MTKGKHSAHKNAQLREELIELKQHTRKVERALLQAQDMLREARHSLKMFAAHGTPGQRQAEAELAAHIEKSQRELDDVVNKHQEQLGTVRVLLERLMKACGDKPVITQTDMIALAEIYDDFVFAPSANREKRRNTKRNMAGPDAARRALNYANNGGA